MAKRTPYMPTIPPVDPPFDEVRAEFWKQVESKSLLCPICDQKARIWKKSISKPTARELIRLVRMYSGEPLHLREFLANKRVRKFSQLALWGLIFPKVNTDTRKKASGFWSPTEKGADFVNRKLTLPKYVFTYDNRIVKWEGPEITIVDALGNKWNYAEMMKEQLWT